MPVSNTHGCLFIHIPRTGGTTIERLLGIHREWPTLHLDVLHGALILGDEEYQLQHCSLQEAAQFLPEGSLKAHFTFSFCRNPWDRLLSTCIWREGIGDRSDFERFAESTYEIVSERRELAGRNCHLRPQVEFLDGELDFLGRFENFENDVRYVVETLQSPVSRIPHEHRTAHLHYREYYTQRSRQIVARAYEADIDRLGYTF